jgi:hypothetical protein
LQYLALILTTLLGPPQTSRDFESLDLKLFGTAGVGGVITDVLCVKNEGTVRSVPVTSLLPLRSVAKAVGWDVRNIAPGYIHLVTPDGRKSSAPGHEPRDPLIPGQREVPEIYLDGKFVSFGFVWEGVTRVNSVSLRHLGLKQQLDLASDSILVARVGAEFPKPPPGLPVDAFPTKGMSVKGTYGALRIQNPAVIDRQFSAELILDRGHYTDTSKPIQIELVVTLAGDNGAIVARESVAINGVTSNGGSYLLQVPLLKNEDSVRYVAVGYSGAWVRK